MMALLLEKKEPTMKDIEQALLGNLSRCNGYRALFQAFRYYIILPLRLKFLVYTISYVYVYLS